MYVIIKEQGILRDLTCYHFGPRSEITSGDNLTKRQTQERYLQRDISLCHRYLPYFSILLKRGSNKLNLVHQIYDQSSK